MESKRQIIKAAVQAEGGPNWYQQGVTNDVGGECGR